MEDSDEKALDRLVTKFIYLKIVIFIGINERNVV